MKVRNNIHTPSYNTSFQAKFLHSESLKMVADYAVEHNKFEKLNQARKNIDSSFLQTRLKLDIKESKNGNPIVSFTKYEPKKNVNVAYSLDDYEVVKITEFKSEKKINPLKFALEKIIKLGNNAPRNNMYKNVIISNK